METTFPFGFPTATAFYLTLFVGTLILHVLFMNFVVAGTGWLAWASLRGRLRFAKSVSESNKLPATGPSLLADWIPSMLSGAITAGVAPLLFVQILYQKEFYSANLLLSHRWMSILPVLILGFYALYVLRTDWLARRSGWVRTLTALIPFASVAFVAYSWTENHLLSTSGVDNWRRFYAEGQSWYFEPQMLARLATWGIGSIPTMCVWLGWMAHYRVVRGLPVEESIARQLPRLALVGVAVSLLCAVAYVISAPQLTGVFVGSMALPYLALAIVGVVLQVAGWTIAVRKSSAAGGLPYSGLVMASAGVLATIAGMTVCREAIRLTALGAARLEQLYPRHQAALEVEGFWVFAFFLLLNAGLIVWCFRLVRKNLAVAD